MIQKNARIPTATLLARLSERSYSLPGESSSRWQSRLREELEELEVVPVTMVDTADVQFFVGEHYLNRIICVRGTDSEAESVTNVLARRVEDSLLPDVKVHARFAADVAVIEEALRVRGLNLQDGMRNWFTGHSRGGSIALIMAARSQFRYGIRFHSEQGRSCWKETPKINHAVTHSAPKAGNWAFAKHCERHLEHIRWQRAGDIVPLLPLAPFYWHDTPSQFFDSKDIYRPNATTLTRWFEWPAAIRAEASRPGLACLGLHDMRMFRRLIEKEESELHSGNLLKGLLV
jgi:hypothetical protein